MLKQSSSYLFLYTNYRSEFIRSIYCIYKMMMTVYSKKDQKTNKVFKLPYQRNTHLPDGIKNFIDTKSYLHSKKLP